MFVINITCKENNPATNVELTPSNMIRAASGGTITTQDGVSLEIPPGALLQDTEIHVSSIDATLMHEWGIRAVHLEPDGLILQKPAILKLPMPSDWPADHTPMIFVSFGSDPADYFDMGITADIISSGDNLYAQTELLHFSQYGAINNCHKGTLVFYWKILNNEAAIMMMPGNM